MVRDVGIGIIGANPDSGWAFTAHVPAIEATAGVRVAAVSTTRAETAKRAAAMLNGVAWYTDGTALAADPGVDVVLVAVKVPHHDELIRAAVGAGKHVLSEWPLGATTREAENLQALTDTAGVHGFISLQGRSDPAIRAAQQFIASRLGDLVAVAVRSSRVKGHAVSEAAAYTLDVRSAAGNLEVHGGHIIDLVQTLLPDLKVSSGRTGLVATIHTVAETGAVVSATSPDVFQANLTHTSAGQQGIGTITAWDGDLDAETEIVITGTTGQVRLRTTNPGSPRLRQPQMAPFAGELVTADSRQELIPAADPLPVAARNIAPLYAAIARDLRQGTALAPTFHDAVALHKALDVVRSGSVAAE